MENFYRELPQLRCTELQLKMRFAGLHLQLKRVAHEQNTRLAVSSRAQRGSVADKWVFCEGVWPFEVAAGRPTEFSISSDNLNWGNSRGKICHWVLYGILRLTIVIYSHLQLTIVIYSHISEMDSWLNFKLSRPKVSQNWTKMAKYGQKHSCTNNLITRCKKVSTIIVCSNSSVG